MEKIIEGPLILFIVVITIILIYSIIIKDEKKILTDLKSGRNIIILCIIVVIIFYSLFYSTNQKLRSATYSAIAAFIIAISSYLQLPLTSFFFIWIYHYFFHGYRYMRK